MPVIQHQAILLDNSLAVARPNPNKKEKIEHYANIAFPPAAAADIHAMLLAAANGVPLNKLYLPVVKNEARKNQQGASTTIAGVPGDWLIMRVSTTPEYPPARLDADGVELTDAASIGRVFYAGRRVIADVWFKLSAPHQKGQTIFGNIAGIVAQADGERLAIGHDTRGALARFATPGAGSGAAPGANATTVAQGPSGEPFGGAQSTGQQQTAQQSAQPVNPFAQGAAAAPGAGPFG